jgi:hypothetical protein
MLKTAAGRMLQASHDLKDVPLAEDDNWTHTL